MKRRFSFDKETCQFDYSVSEFDKICTKNYIDAIDNTILTLYSRSKSLGINKIALCLSGIDSELIANGFHKLGITCEYFFLYIKSINEAHYKIAKEISLNHKTILNVIEVSTSDIFDYIIDEVFDICPVYFPGYVVAGIIPKFIPSDYYIIIGEGDLEKTGVNKYLTIYNNSKVTNDNIYIPIHLSEILYNQSIKHFNRNGESNFYSVDFNTWYHILNDRRLRSNFKFFYDPKSSIIFNDYKSTTKYFQKTDNFEIGKTNEIAKKIFSHLIIKTNKNWNPYIGTLVSIPKTLITRTYNT